jgi:mRNA interferase RelE/StbE
VELVVKRSAQKDLLRLPRVDRERIEARVEAYLAEPAALFHDVKPVVGKPMTFRLRAGDWRVIFILEDDMMVVTRVAHRGEIYR